MASARAIAKRWRWPPETFVPPWEISVLKPSSMSSTKSAWAISRRSAHAFGIQLVGGVVDVFLNRAAEQEGLLRNVAQLAAQRVQRQVANIDAVDGNGAFRHVSETLHEFDHRRLARTGRADDGRGLTRLRGEVDMLEHAILRARISEAHVVESDFGTTVRAASSSSRHTSVEGSAIELSVLSTSSMRWAATSARGSMIESMPIIRKPMIITME